MCIRDRLLKLVSVDFEIIDGKERPPEVIGYRSLTDQRGTQGTVPRPSVGGLSSPRTSPEGDDGTVNPSPSPVSTTETESISGNELSSFFADCGQRESQCKHHFSERRVHRGLGLLKRRKATLKIGELPAMPKAVSYPPAAWAFGDRML